MLMTAARFTEPWEAHLFRMLLEAEGLFAVVAFDQHASTNYSFAWALGGVRVLVVEEELEQAFAIERHCRSGGYAALLDAEFGLPALSVRREPARWYRVDVVLSCFVSLLTALIFGVVAPIRVRSGS
jgi:hypothetical protein